MRECVRVRRETQAAAEEGGGGGRGGKEGEGGGEEGGGGVQDTFHTLVQQLPPVVLARAWYPSVQLSNPAAGSQVGRKASSTWPARSLLSPATSWNPCRPTTATLPPHSLRVHSNW